MNACQLDWVDIIVTNPHFLVFHERAIPPLLLDDEGHLVCTACQTVIGCAHPEHQFDFPLKAVVPPEPPDKKREKKHGR